MQRQPPKRPKFEPFVAGAFSGACSTLVLQPLDLIKTRLQLPANSDRRYPNHLREIVEDVVRKDGVTGLWKGLCPIPHPKNHIEDNETIIFQARFFKHIQMFILGVFAAYWHNDVSLVRTVPGIGVYFCSLNWLTRRLKSSSHISALDSLFLGACARSIAGLSTIPFTVIKTRYESGVFSYRSVAGAFLSIYKTEGFRGLSSGLFATLLRDVPFSGIYLMFYNGAKKTVGNSSLSSFNNPSIHFSCGLFAGCLASIVTHPPDVVKTHLQLYPSQFSSTYQAILHILKTHGVSGLFRGMVPRLVRRTLMAALSWTVYEQVIQMIYVES